MDAPVLLDTCAAIWIANNDPLSKQALDAVDRAHTARDPIYVSPITAWELGLLVARNRISLLMPPARWFEKLLQTSGVQLADMTPDVLIASSFLPSRSWIKARNSCGAGFVGLSAMAWSASESAAAVLRIL